MIQLTPRAAQMGESNSDRALRYRQRAMQARVAAITAVNDVIRQRLLKRAADFDSIAEIYETGRRNPHRLER